MRLPGCATRLVRTLPDIREQLTSVHAGWVAACINLRWPIGSPATHYDIPHCGCRQKNRRPTGSVAPRSFHIGKRCDPRVLSPEDQAYYSYVLAKMYAKRGDVERCLECLRKAKDEGSSYIKDVNKDPEFAIVLTDPRFVELMSKPAPEK